MNIQPAPVTIDRPTPLVLAPDSWQARMVRKAEILHALGKPCIMVVRLGDVAPHWFRTVPEK